jgi:hypothetical protein
MNYPFPRIAIGLNPRELRGPDDVTNSGFREPPPDGSVQDLIWVARLQPVDSTIVILSCVWTVVIIRATDWYDAPRWGMGFLADGNNQAGRWAHA